jgi:hypothetical protein
VAAGVVIAVPVWALTAPDFGGVFVVAVESLAVAPFERLRESPASTVDFDAPLVMTGASFGVTSLDRLRVPPACALAEAKANAAIKTSLRM